MTSFTKQLVDQAAEPVTDQAAKPASEWVSTAKLMARCAELEAVNARLRSALGEVDHVLDTQIPARAKPQPPPTAKSRAQTLKVMAQSPLRCDESTRHRPLLPATPITT